MLLTSYKPSRAESVAMQTANTSSMELPATNWLGFKTNSLLFGLPSS